MHAEGTALTPPDDYVTAGLLNVVGGTFNACAGFTWVFFNWWCCGIGFVWLVPMIVGVWQAGVGYQMAMGRRAHDSQSAGIAGIVAGALSLNLWGVGASMVAMMIAQRPQIRAWLEGRE